jgi:hypothetical protein
MDDRTRAPHLDGAATRSNRQLLLASALAAVAALTLMPVGTGWTWGDPAAELRWYVTGLGSEATLLQLLGNLCLLAAPAGLAVRLWPAAGRTAVLAVLAVGAAGGIELLQWALPLGRVVSPVDAALNAAGAVAAGLLVRHLPPARAHRGPRRQAGVTS